jgi:hypothetical protein
MSKQIPTAEEFIEKYLDVDSDFMESVRSQMSKMSGFDFNNIPDLMIEFAKLHVKAALEAAADSSFKSSSGDWSVQHTPNAKSSILNAYPENLII